MKAEGQPQCEKCLIKQIYYRKQSEENVPTFFSFKLQENFIGEAGNEFLVFVKSLKLLWVDH